MLAWLDGLLEAWDRGGFSLARSNCEPCAEIFASLAYSLAFASTLVVAAAASLGLVLAILVFKRRDRVSNLVAWKSRGV